MTCCVRRDRSPLLDPSSRQSNPDQATLDAPRTFFRIGPTLRSLPQMRCDRMSLTTSRATHTRSTLPHSSAHPHTRHTFNTHATRATHTQTRNHTRGTPGRTPYARAPRTHATHSRSLRHTRTQSQHLRQYTCATRPTTPHRLQTRPLDASVGRVTASVGPPVRSCA